MQDTLINFLAARWGKEAVKAADEEAERYLIEPRDKYLSQARAILRPNSTKMVAEMVLFAREKGLKIIPQGGNTGLVGAQSAFDKEKHLILSLERLNKVREIDLKSETFCVEAGVTLQQIQEIAKENNRLFPLSLASEGSCQIGGNLSSNAGGVNVLAYGNARDLCIGLEVVTADGRIWNGLRKLKKDNTGYDLKDLFIGAEGTLGVITAAQLKLFPRPKDFITAYVAFENVENALRLFHHLKSRFHTTLTSFELISDFAEYVSLTHGGAKKPLHNSAPWYGLFEVSCFEEIENAQNNLFSVLEEATNSEIILDAIIAQNMQQREALWHLRESISEAQKGEGGSIKHDISLPLDKIPLFLANAKEALSAYMPNIRPCPFGHLGDGNLHYNITQPIGMDKQEYLEHWGRVNDIIHEMVVRLEGSFSAEHGIGQLKRDMMRKAKSPVELDMMKRIKVALDPECLFNPEKLLP